jgi:hypothetical protein
MLLHHTSTMHRAETADVCKPQRVTNLARSSPAVFEWFNGNNRLCTHLIHQPGDDQPVLACSIVWQSLWYNDGTYEEWTIRPFSDIQWCAISTREGRGGEGRGEGGRGRPARHAVGTPHQRTPHLVLLPPRSDRGLHPACAPTAALCPTLVHLQ